LDELYDLVYASSLAPEGAKLDIEMSRLAQAINQQLEAQHRRALAPNYDPVRRDFELGLAERLEREAGEILTPSKSLQNGLGGEIVPRVGDGLPGLESTLREPDLLNAEASQQRAHLLERAGTLELGIETAQQANATNAIEKMLCHQIAALHRRALTLLAESEDCKDHDVAVKKARAAARMVDASSRAALTIQRLQSGVGQTIQVQYVQVNTTVGEAVGKAQNSPLIEASPKSPGGRPPITGDRTKAAIAQRQADKKLIDSLRAI
jgi:hypothetical protein